MLEGLTGKEYAVVVVSLFALIISVLSAFFTIRAAFEKRADDARKFFDDAIIGVQTARADLESIRRELGDQFDNPDNYSKRVLIADRRNFFISRALNSINEERFTPSGYDNLLLAAALIDSGRSGRAVPFYMHAVEDAADEFERASARRVLGRALILSGDWERGRAEMQLSMEEFYKLEHDWHFDKARMRREAVETLRRLVEASMSVGLSNEVKQDSEELRRLIPTVLLSAQPLYNRTLKNVAEWLNVKQESVESVVIYKDNSMALLGLGGSKIKRHWIRQIPAAIRAAKVAFLVKMQSRGS